MNNEEKKIIELVNGQSFFILCTQGSGQPYGSLIAYTFTNDLKNFFFATSKNTRKYKLLSKCSKVAVVIDSRCNNMDEFMKIDVVTITGNTEQISKSEKDFEMTKGFLKKRHPYLSDFLESDYLALFRIDAENFFYVNHFQEVFEWKP
jgi:heme iron utilization protein